MCGKNVLASSLLRNKSILINVVRHYKSFKYKCTQEIWSYTSWDSIKHKHQVLEDPVLLTWTQQCAHLVYAGEEFFHLRHKRRSHLRKIHLTETRLKQLWLLREIFLRLLWKTNKSHLLSSCRRAMIWTSVRSCNLYPMEMESSSSSEVLSSLSIDDCGLKGELLER